MFGENNMEESIIKELINSNAGVEEWKKAGFNDLQALGDYYWH